METTARPGIRRAFAWRRIMTSSIAKMAAGGGDCRCRRTFRLDQSSRGPTASAFWRRRAPLRSPSSSGAMIVHIQNEIIVYAGSSDLPAGLDSVWLPMCSVKPDGGLQIDQLKLAAAPESYVVTDHSWYDPATGRFSRILKTGDAVVFANSYDGQFVYDATVTAEGVVQVTRKAIAGGVQAAAKPRRVSRHRRRPQDRPGAG